MQPTRVFVRGLPLDVKEEGLREIFEAYGQVKLIHIPEAQPKDKEQTAFIVYSDHESAHKAIVDLNYAKVESNEIKLTYGDEETLDFIQSGENKLIVEGFDSSVTEHEIYRNFSQYGEVIYCAMATAITGKATGLYFITYRNKSEADSAIEQLDGQNLNGKEIHVRYAPAGLK